jgi:DNA topoisomerase-1
MEELGIGRPSTYAPTINTIQTRKYVVKEDRQGNTRSILQLLLKDGKIQEKTEKESYGYEKAKLSPTDTGVVVNKFLIENFPEIVDYNFTASVEKQFDAIAEGKIEWVKMIADFYGKFHEKINFTDKNAKKESGERVLGKDPKTGKPISAKIGKYGPYIQLGEATDEEKPKFVPLPKEFSVSTVTLQDVLKLFDLPRKVGQFEDKEITAAIGRFGPYLKHNNKFYSIPKTESVYSVDESKAIEIIESKREADSKKIVKEFPNDKDLQVLNGRWGVYIKYKKKNFKIPKKYKDKDLSYDDCMEIIQTAGETKKASKK